MKNHRKGGGGAVGGGGQFDSSFPPGILGLNTLEACAITLQDFKVLFYLQYVMQTIASRYLTSINIGATAMQLFWQIQNMESY